MAVFYNQANLSYTGGSTSSNIVTGEILEAVTITKTAVTDEYGTGDTVTYIVGITNTGNSAYTGLSVTDDLGAYPLGAITVVPETYVADSVKFFVNGVAAALPTVTQDPLTFGNISIPALGNAILIYSVSVNNTAPVEIGGEVINTVTLEGDGLTPTTATETITVREEPALTITKCLSPTTITDNSTLTYTLSVRNFGNTPAIATDNLVITDTFSPTLSDITVTINGATATEGTDYTYNPVTGEFATVGGVVTVPAATFTQNPATGEWTVIPGETVVVIRGTV